MKKLLLIALLIVGCNLERLGGDFTRKGCYTNEDGEYYVDCSYHGFACGDTVIVQCNSELHTCVGSCP